jgi:glycosyltransferase involved in cell wall biosynthesis
MRILFSVHLYPPKHNCGGEYYIHNMAKYLISKGHECRILLHQAKTYGITKPYNYEGIEVFPAMKQMDGIVWWADRVFTHLEFTPWTVNICKVLKRPVFFIVHNTHVYKCAINPKLPMNVIYNSQYAREVLNYPHPSMVLHPPVDWRKYDVCPDPINNRYITLINLNKNKGGEIFYEIAKRMPDKVFLGVKGSYDPQIVHNLSNVVILENTPDILSIYRQTRILLMPSEYESWGMTCTEAMCNGIPVISTRTFGLNENAAHAGIFVDREDIDGWVREIRRLDKKNVYLRQSEICRHRSRELDPLQEYQELENFIQTAK